MLCFEQQGQASGARQGGSAIDQLKGQVGVNLDAVLIQINACAWRELKSTLQNQILNIREVQCVLRTELKGASRKCDALLDQRLCALLCDLDRALHRAQHVHACCRQSGDDSGVVEFRKNLRDVCVSNPQCHGVVLSKQVLLQGVELCEGIARTVAAHSQLNAVVGAQKGNAFDFQVDEFGQ